MGGAHLVNASAMSQPYQHATQMIALVATSRGHKLESLQKNAIDEAMHTRTEIAKTPPMID